MITSFNKFEKLNEDINYRAMQMCGHYRVNDEQITSILNELESNNLEFKYIPEKNYIEIETFEFDKPYDIILKNGGDRLSFSLTDEDYEHDCVLLRSKPIIVPDGAYM